MKVVIGSGDRYLTDNIRRLVQAERLFAISTNKVERILDEMKSIDRLAIIDMAWESIQERGVLKRVINIARISANIVVCICPNQDEDLKKLARAVRADEVFLRFDLETRFKEFLKEVYQESTVKKSE